MTPAVSEHPVVRFLRRAKNSWASRSLLIGALATVIDIALGSVLLKFGVSTRFAAMAGTVLGATFTYFANKYFAFKSTEDTGASALKFVAVTILASLVHGQVVVWLRDHFGIPFVVSKMAADIVIFTFGQLLLLRYVVFPQTKVKPPPAPPVQQHPLGV